MGHVALVEVGRVRDGLTRIAATSSSGAAATSNRPARVRDLFMSLIYACQLNEVNPFDCLTQLQRHTDPLAASPQLWMPWNYREAPGTSPARQRTETSKVHRNRDARQDVSEAMVFGIAADLSAIMT